MCHSILNYWAAESTGGGLVWDGVEPWFVRTTAMILSAEAERSASVYIRKQRN